MSDRKIRRQLNKEAQNFAPYRLVATKTALGMSTRRAPRRGWGLGLKLSIGLAVLIFAIVVTFIAQPRPEVRAASDHVVFTLNPNLDIQVAPDNRVSALKALNSDAQLLIAGEEDYLTGQPVELVLGHLIKRSEQLGFADAAACLNLQVAAKTTEREAELQALLTKQMAQLSAGFAIKVGKLSQAEQRNADLVTKAAEKSGRSEKALKKLDVEQLIELLYDYDAEEVRAFMRKFFTARVDKFYYEWTIRREKLASSAKTLADTLEDIEEALADNEHLKAKVNLIKLAGLVGGEYGDQALALADRTDQARTTEFQRLKQALTTGFAGYLKKLELQYLDNIGLLKMVYRDGDALLDEAIKEALTIPTFTEPKWTGDDAEAAELVEKINRTLDLAEKLAAKEPAAVKKVYKEAAESYLDLAELVEDDELSPAFLADPLYQALVERVGQITNPVFRRALLDD